MAASTLFNYINWRTEGAMAPALVAQMGSVLARPGVTPLMQVWWSTHVSFWHYINGRYAEFDWTPLRYLNKSFNHRILSGFYRAARIGLVTPFRDGMNLVAKEYVAAQQPEDPGMLVLSCFAGAVREMAEGIWQGLQMPLEERRERWAAMMTTLRRNDVNSWREGFLKALTAAGTGR